MSTEPTIIADDPITEIEAKLLANEDLLKRIVANRTDPNRMVRHSRAASESSRGER